jgi:hypothetical protein
VATASRWRTTPIAYSSGSGEIVECPQRVDEGARAGGGRYLFEALARLAQQFLGGRGHVFGADAVERHAKLRRQKRIQIVGRRHLFEGISIRTDRDSAVAVRQRRANALEW